MPNGTLLAPVVMVGEWSICLAHCMRRGGIIQTWHAVLGQGAWAVQAGPRRGRGLKVGQSTLSRVDCTGRFGGAFAVSLAGMTRLSTSSDCQLNFPKSHVLADSGIDYGVKRVIDVTRFAGARQQSDEVDSVLTCSEHTSTSLSGANSAGSIWKGEKCRKL